MFTKDFKTAHIQQKCKLTSPFGESLAKRCLGFHLTFAFIVLCDEETRVTRSGCLITIALSFGTETLRSVFFVARVVCNWVGFFVKARALV